ncbi:hypothetical protein ACTGU5_12185, partial [Streptococcus suis]
GDAQYIVQELGEIVPPRNSAVLVQAILNYVQQSNDQRLQLKQAVRERVEAHFSIEKVSQQYMQVWEQSR